VNGREGGQVLPLFAVGVALAGLLAFGVARVGADAVDAARARTAADAAALAGAAAGEGAARRLATLNGGRLRGFAATEGVVTVEVAVAGRAATARARRQPAAGSEPAGAGKEGADVHRRGSPASP
jgi:hypothetical protein